MKLEKITIAFIFLFAYSAFCYELGRKDERERLMAQTDSIEVCDTIIVPQLQELKKEASKPQTKTKPKTTKKKTTAKSSNKYAVSANGKSFIKTQEGCVLTAYYDTNGYSIGYGHHKKEIYKGMTITIEQAETFFEDDIKEVNENINYLLKDINYNFNQNFIDGLGSLIYNCGCGGIQRSSFYKTLLQCRWDASEEVLKQDLTFTLSKIRKISYKTHKNRRNAEHALMSQL